MNNQTKSFMQIFGVLFGNNKNDNVRMADSLPRDDDKIFVGTIIDTVTEENVDGGKTCDEPKYFQKRVYKNGFLAVRNGKIVGLDSAEKLRDFKRRYNFKEACEVFLGANEILIPGLIDTHIHAPQYPNAGLGYDKQLLDWLDTYTYPMEMKYKDLKLAKEVFDKVVLKTLSHGTTTACYFATMYVNSSMVLVDSVVEKGQRALVGKINMQRLAPEGYVETAEDSLADTEKFVKYVADKNSELVKAIITPRFAPSCDEELLKQLGDLAKKYDLHIQSHISENEDEITLVKGMFKNNTYGDVYDVAGLLTHKTVMAHGVHLTDQEIQMFAERQTGISHCPSSNTDLRSGLCDVKKLLKAGVKVGLGSDISGGENPSIVAQMRQALATSIHISFGKRGGYTPLNYWDAFHLATLGGAKVLALEQKIGNFDVGKDFDALIVNLETPGITDLIKHREYDPEELLQKFIYVGDDRNVKEVYVAGNKLK